MSEASPELHLVFNESGDNPLVLESTWTGAPGRKNPCLKDVGHAKKRLGALAILFLLAKYRETRPEPDLRFQVDIDKQTWICTLTQNIKKVKKWINDHFHVNDDDMFVETDYGTTHADGGLTYPSVQFLADNLPLRNVHLSFRAKHSPTPKVPLRGRMLLDLALKIEARYWPHSKSAVRMLEATDEVRDFLQNLAEKGLAKRMLFPPPKWGGQSLRDFCIEPWLITEARWEAVEETRLVCEMMRLRQGQAAPLGRVLGDERHGALHRRVILRGNPGEGKSMALWLHVGNQCASLIARLNSGEIGIESEEFKVPLVLPLGDSKVKNRDLVTLAIEKVLEISFGRGEGVTAQAVRKWLRMKAKRGEYTLALDALDELSLPAGLDGETWLREEIQDIPSFVPILLTTRPNTIDTTLGLSIGQSAGQFEIYRMMDFGKTQVRSYVRGYFGEHGEKAESLLSRLQQSPGPKQLAQLPLLLAALCHAHDENDPDVSLPSTRTEILGTALWRLFDSGHKKRALKFEQTQQGTESSPPAPSPDPLRDRLKEALLQYVALKFWRDGPLPMRDVHLQAELGKGLAALKCSRRVENAWAKERAKHFKLSRLIEEFCEDGILVQTLAGGQKHYRFVLRSFHEYLVAGYFASEENEKMKKRISDFVHENVVELHNRWFEDNWLCIWSLAAGQGAHIASQFLSTFDPPEYFTYGAHFYEGFPKFLGRIVSESKCSQASYWVSRLVELVELEPRFSPTVVGALGEIGGSMAEKELLDWMLDESDHPLNVGWHWNGWVSNEIVHALARIASPDTRNILIQRLNNPAEEREHRRRCAEALGEIGDVPSQDALIARLNDKSDDGTVRSGCAIGLGEIGDKRSRDELIARLQEATEDQSTRGSCAGALSRIRDVESRSALIACFQSVSDNDEWLGVKCAEALGYSHDVESRSALISRLRTDTGEKMSRIREFCARALGEIGSAESRVALMTQLNDASDDEDATVRRACAEALGKLGDAESREALVARLQDSSSDASGVVRGACATALKEIDDDMSRAALVARLRDPTNDPTGSVRYACASALRYLNTAECRPVVITRLSNPTGDEDGFVRRACAKALGQIGDVECRSALISRLKNPSEDVEGRIRIECAKALGEIGDEQSIESLMARFQDPADDATGGIRYECAKILNLTGHVQCRPILIARLLNPRGDGEGVVREECAGHLMKMGDAESRSALISRLLDASGGNRNGLRAACARALGGIRDAESCSTLIEMLRNTSDDRNNYVRGICAEVLCGIANTDSHTALIATLNDPAGDEHGHVRKQCAQALGEIGGDESRTALIARLRNSACDEGFTLRLGCILGLYRIGDAKSISVLIECLFNVVGDNGGRFRSVCAEALGELGGAESREALIKRLKEQENDEGGRVRQACASALGCIADQQSRTALIARLRDPSGDKRGNIRSRCALALQKIGDTESRTALVERLHQRKDDVDGWIRLACAKALDALGDANSRKALRRCLTATGIPDNVRQACYDAGHLISQ